ncbi:MAG: RNA-binding protein domain [Chthoniobacteraceae bacterium]|nr:RNA-binding protein domain [Chthoniobacteraceae bacterium]
MHQAAMQEFLDYVLRQLIDFPEEMVLTKTEADEKRAVFKVRLRQSDVGKVIGKHGHTIIAIRNLLAAAAARHGEKAILDIVEEHATS